jgi:Rieske Fe-S protein
MRRRGALLSIAALTAPRGANAKCKGIDAGPVASFKVGSFKLLATDEGRFIAARDDKGFYAMTAMCPHMGGSIELVDDKGTTKCPSHGSMFNGNGDVILGPATRPLLHLAVILCEGRVRIDYVTIVDPSARTT